MKIILFCSVVICTQVYARTQQYFKSNVYGSRDGDTPLHLSIKRGYTNITKLLIAKGAEVNIKDSYGNTPSHNAVLFANPDALGLLIQHNANLNLRNRENETPLLLAVANENFELTKILVDSNAIINNINATYKNPLALSIKQDNVKFLKLFLDKGINVNDRVNGLSLIEMAVKSAATDVTRFLLERGADYAVKTNDGDTLLYIAIYSNYLDIAELLLNATSTDSPLYGNLPIY